MGPILWLITGALGGAGLMYLFDPRMGRRRRALVRDQMVHAAHEAADMAEQVGEMTGVVKDHTQGMVATARRTLDEGQLDDLTLMERVRAAIGHAIVHAGAIEVRVANGEVILAGPVLQSELDQLLRTVKAVPGVRNVDNRLMVFEQAANIPDLQGGPQTERQG